MDRFTKYLRQKGLSQSTQEAYTRYIRLFLQWCNADQTHIEKKDILKYLEYLKKRKQQQNITRRNSLIALTHYFEFLRTTEHIIINPCSLLKIRGTQKKQLYRIYTIEELEQLFDNYYQLFVRTYDSSHIPQNQREQSALTRERNAAVLSILIYQGITTKEADMIFLTDIDLIKATINIKGSKKSNERKLKLEAAQIGLLMHYIEHTRPQLMTYQESENNKLFLPLPEYSKQNTNNQSIMSIFKPLTKQVKTLDTNFLNFKQVRASVITNWIKTVGLRKAQHMAGHRYISSTENYLPNDMEQLTDDIEKYNPFTS